MTSAICGIPDELRVASTEIATGTAQASACIRRSIAGETVSMMSDESSGKDMLPPSGRGLVAWRDSLADDPTKATTAR